MNRPAPADGYWASVATPALRPQPTPGPYLSWDVPFELALFASTSALAPVVFQRAARGEFPAATALVTSSGDQLVATLAYPTGQLFLPLRPKLMERGR